MRRIGLLVLLLLAGCRACSTPSSEVHDAIPPEGSDGSRVSAGPLSLVLPSGWSPTDRQWPIPEGATLLGKFSGDAADLWAKGFIVVLRVSSGVAWTWEMMSQVAAEDGAWSLADAGGDRAIFTATIPAPWEERDRIRYFAQRGRLVIFECETTIERQDALCDKHFDRLLLMKDAGPGFRFDPPQAWKRTPAPAGEMFTSDEEPGFRLSVGSSAIARQEPASATLDRLRRTFPADAGSVVSERRFIHQEAPGLELTIVKPRGFTEWEMRMARFSTPGGDGIIVVCTGERAPEVDAACEAALASVQLR